MPSPRLHDRARRAGEAAVETRRAHVLLAAVIVLWGANWPVMKYGLESITPLWFGTARLTMGAASLFLLLLVRGRIRLPPREDLSVLVSVALLQMTGFMALVNVALVYVPAGRAAVLAYTTPLWVTPVAVFLLGERLTRRKLVGLVCGLTGLTVLFNPLAFDWRDRDVVIGNGILMLTALAGAIAILHVRAHRWKSSPLQLAPWQMLLASPLLAGLALFFEDFDDIRWSGELVAILAYNGPVATAFCFWAAVTVARSLPTISTSVGFLGVPVTGVLLSTLILGEPVSASLLAGLVLILGGMALVSLAEPGRRHTPGGAP